MRVGPAIVSLLLLLSNAGSATPDPPHLQMPGPDDAQKSTAEPQPSDPKANKHKVKVDHFVLQGNTLLGDEQVRGLLRLYEGRELTLAEMKEAAADLTSLYQRKGFYLVHVIVPAQDFSTTEVKLLAVEGKVGKIRVEGAEHYDPAYIRARFQSAVSDGNFRAQDFTRAMLLLNELPDLDVKAVFAPGSVDGTADVVLKVKDQTPIHGGVEYNNYGTEATGKNRIGLSFDAGNLLTQADQLSLRGTIGFPSRNNDFFQVGYAAPLNLEGTTASFSYANGAFAVSDGLGAILDVRGRADIFTGSVSTPLDRDLDFTSNLALALAHKNVTNNFFGGRVPFSHDEYTMSRLTYAADWRGPSGRTILQASWAQGLGGSPPSDPLISRAGANGHFSRFNVDLARIQRLDEGLYGVLRGSVQVATSPLYVGEQFALGGPDTVRGFPQAGLLGDSAYLIGAELRYSPIHDKIDAFQIALFIDHGTVWLNQRQAGDLPYGSSLTGAGIGFRWKLWEDTNLRFDLGFPISPRIDSLGTGPAPYIGLQSRY